MDDNTQAFAISVILVGLITYLIVWFSLYLSRNTLLYCQHEDVKMNLPFGSSLVWQLSLYVAIVAAFAAALAFF